MGQKTNPIGLRVGLHQKWACSWYGANATNTNFFDTSTSNQMLSPRGVNYPRGSKFSPGIEHFVESLIKRYSVTKFSKTKRILLVDFRFFKGFGGYTYGFLIYTKLVGRRKTK